MLRMALSVLFVFLPPAAPCLWAQNSYRGDAIDIDQQTLNRIRASGLPLAFETNHGQAGRGVDFVLHGQGYSAQLRADGVILSISTTTSDGSDERKASGENVVEITLAGANRSAAVTGDDELPGHSHYLLGSNPAAWITDVEQYTKVHYSDVYPGIDLVFHGNGTAPGMYSPVVTGTYTSGSGN